jgi:hypothetical protein
MSARDELLDALSVERQTSPWWTTPPAEIDDSETTCARRRRDMAKDFESTKTRPRKVA